MKRFSAVVITLLALAFGMAQSSPYARFFMPAASDPTSPLSGGQVVYRSDTGAVRYYNGAAAAWQTLTSVGAVIVTSPQATVGAGTTLYGVAGNSSFNANEGNRQMVLPTGGTLEESAGANDQHTRRFRLARLHCPGQRRFDRLDGDGQRRSGGV